MRRAKRCLAATLLAAGLLIGSAAQAMEIEQFDRMAIEDQGDYVQRLLQGAQEILMNEGKHDLLARLNTLFGEVRTGDQTSIGIIEFETNLANARVLDAERYAKDHSAVRLEVEHAMLVTLKRNGIVLPKSFMHVMDDFKPKQPLR